MGIVVFSSLAEAVSAGYQLLERTVDGFLVRKNTAAGWALAVVRVR